MQRAVVWKSIDAVSQQIGDDLTQLTCVDRETSPASLSARATPFAAKNRDFAILQLPRIYAENFIYHLGKSDGGPLERLFHIRLSSPSTTRIEFAGTSSRSAPRQRESCIDLGNGCQFAGGVVLSPRFISKHQFRISGTFPVLETKCPALLSATRGRRGGLRRYRTVLLATCRHMLETLHLDGPSLRLRAQSRSRT